MRYRWMLVWIFSMQCLYVPYVSADAHPYYSKHPVQKKLLEALLKRTNQLKRRPFQRFSFDTVLSDVHGKSFSMKSLRGKLILLTRWATWCKACKAELPGKLKLLKMMPPSKLAIVGVTNEKKTLVSSFMKKVKPGTFFPINLHDPKNTMLRTLSAAYLPVTVIIDPWGWIVAERVGPGMWHWKAHREVMRFLSSPGELWKQNQKRYRSILREYDAKAPPQMMFVRGHQVDAHRPFKINFIVRWKGEKDRFRVALVHPKLHADLTWLKSVNSAVSTYNGTHVVVISAHMTARKKGSYQIPIVFEYLRKGSKTPSLSNQGKLSLYVREKARAKKPSNIRKKKTRANFTPIHWGK